MQQMIKLASILTNAGIRYLESEHSDAAQTDAIIIPLFGWQGERAGIVIDCDPQDMSDIHITGHLPEAVTKDLDAHTLLETVNADNEKTPGIQIYAKDGSVYARKTVDTTYGLHEDIVINAIYDVNDILTKYKKAARKRGNFPISEPSYQEVELPT